MSGSDDGRGNREERENGRAQVDRLDLIERRKLTRWRCVECGNLLTHHRDDCPKCEGDVISEEIEYVPADAYAGAVRPLEEALGRAADALDHAAANLEEARFPLSAQSARASAAQARGQSEPSPPWPAWADRMRPRGRS